MKLSDVCGPLRQTIKDKQEYLQQVKLQPSHPGSVAEMTLTVVRMLDVNIAELERILADLERCDQL
jgi:hypothetical protein